MSRALPVMIRGTGSYVPEEVLTNDFFASYLDTSDEWIRPRTGIQERRRVANHESTLTLSKTAAERALDNAGLEARDLDMILVATATPETPLPSTACWLQAELGLDNIPAFDIAAACTGFVYGLVIAGSMIAAGEYQHVLLVGAETLTRITDFQDRSTAILFGDAAGAAVVSRTDDPERRVIYHEIGARGTGAKAVWIPAGGSKRPVSPATIAERLHYMKMKGSDLFKSAVTTMNELVRDTCDVTGIAPDDIKLLIPHQSNLRIMESARKRIGLPVEKLGRNIERYGNTSAASIPLVLDEARRNGTVKDGDLVMLLGFGAGLTWGVVLMRL
jgi:3-oxoacyl-[acyl-carrier-protein] synthase-3